MKNVIRNSKSGRVGENRGSQYSSTPHLFVFQTSEDDETIYSSAHELCLRQAQEKAAIRKITEKYDSLKRLTQQAASLDISEDLLILSERECMQIESLYRGHKTQVFVCRSLANLYMGSVHKNGSWEWKLTGVPLLLLDCGQTRCRDKRGIQIVLAERGSGFQLWKDRVDNLTDYRPATDTFHTFYLSTDHRKTVGLSFDDPTSASEFWSQVERLTSDPENISLSGPGRKRRKDASGRRSRSKSEKPGRSARKPRKCEISLPCAFQHITSVEVEDRSQLYSLQAFVDSGLSSEGTRL